MIAPPVWMDSAGYALMALSLAIFVADVAMVRARTSYPPLRAFFTVGALYLALSCIELTIAAAVDDWHVVVWAKFVLASVSVVLGVYGRVLARRLALPPPEPIARGYDYTLLLRMRAEADAAYVILRRDRPGVS